MYTQVAFNDVSGIAVDTHCHRISNRLKWVNTSNPNETKQRLEELFDKEEWGHINHVLVGFGQAVCKAKLPKCDVCPINHICISEDNYMKQKKVKKVNKTRKKSKNVELDIN